jgi:high-affinity iron transporter
MLPTFVIGLREGLEAALIVGIIAAFLRKQARRDLLRAVLLGVATAVALCAVIGIGLELYSRDLPQRQQEGLETVIGALAVAMVTYMVVWMRRHSRELKGQLEGMAADAMTARSSAGRAMVLMAFLAVIREGLETVVFLLAAFNEAGSGPAAGVGAVLGIVVAVGLGYGVYRGGVRLNLSKFFRATGLVLVLVAAGLVVNALHTAHEAGWLDAGQGSTVDLSWLVQPGTVQASLLTGMLGVQSHPVVIEVVGWLLYFVPVGCYVAWPQGKALPARALARGCAIGAALAVAATGVLALAAPARPALRPTAVDGGVQAVVVSRDANHAIVSTQARQPIVGSTGSVQRFVLHSLGVVAHAGLTTEAFRAQVPGGTGAVGRPASLAAAALAGLNGDRLPIGLALTGETVPVRYRDTRTLTVWLDTRTDRVVDVSWAERVTATAQSGSRTFALATPVAGKRTALANDVIAAAASAARDAHATLDRRSLLDGLAVWFGVLAGLAILAAAGFGLAGGRRVPNAATVPIPVEERVHS